MGRPVAEAFVHTVAKDVLLTTEEVNIWLHRLSIVFENRKRGAAKSAATYKAKKQLKQQCEMVQTIAPTVHFSIQETTSLEDEEYYCAWFRMLYSSSTAELWIACDGCDEWYCGVCKKVTTESTSKVYFCKKYSNSVGVRDHCVDHNYI